MSSLKIKDEIITARIQLLINQPFFGNLATRLKIKENDTFVNTAATDGRTLFYNVKFFSDMCTDNVVFVVAHEVLHMVFNHMNRKEFRNHKLFNIACDYVVNGILIRDKIGRPPGINYYHDTRFNNMSAEQVYEILLEEGLKDGSCVLIDDHIDWGHSSGDDEDDDTDRPVYSEQELADIRSEIISNVIQAHQASAGTAPVEVKRLISEWTETKMDWRQVIRCTIKSMIKNDFSWAKPSRKSWHINAILPGMNHDQTIDVAFGVDMSGSITPRQANIIISEIKSLMDEYAEFKLDLWSFDTQVYNHVTFTQDNALEIFEYEPVGGGGTDFVVNWEYMKEHGILPKKFIMFTDGYCNGRGFGDPDYCDTLFIMLDSTVVAPFGDTVHYDKE